MAVWSYLIQPLVSAQADQGVADDVSFDTDVKSSNWDGGDDLSGGKDATATAGYLIDFETGAAQFQALYVAGEITGADVYSNNWDGTTPANLASKDGGASTGYYLDDSSGGAQFQQIYAEGGSLGTLDVDGTLTMGTGGKILTASSGQRIEITNTDLNRILFYSGDADEEVAARIAESTSGTGATRTIQTTVHSPYINVDDQGVGLTVRSASADATSTAPSIVISTTVPLNPGAGTGLAPQFRIQNSIPLIMDGVIQMSSLGSAAAPAIGIGSNYDDGMYSNTDGSLNFTTSGVERFNVTSKRLDLATGNIDFLKLPIKSTTGDPASPAAGDMYANTNVGVKALRLYANGAWRTVASW